MIKEIIHFLKEWLKGGEAGLELEIEIDIIDLIFIVLLIGFTIYAIVTWL